MDLQALAASRGLTIHDLAEKMDCAKSTIYHWNKGVYSPNTESILKLCSVLGLTPNELLGVEDHKYSRPVFSRLKELLKAVTKNGRYNSDNLHGTANKIHRSSNKTTELERWIREIAEALYKFELFQTASDAYQEITDEIVQLSMF